MAAYLIADITVHDPDGYKAYAADVAALIAKHGGTYLVRGGAVDVLEGDWTPARLILVEFPDRGAARRFYEDPAYQPLKRIRTSTSRGHLIVVDGHAGG
jgi:uncharacterized protein (DUF1330 family)